jgi:lysophospholipase L1-like esterase
LVAFGEITTAGGGATVRSRCWASRLAEMISDFQTAPVELINAGIGANVISTRAPCYEFSGKPAADERLDKHVIAHRPDLLIISYGLNDSRGGTPLELFRSVMTDLLARIRADVQPLIVLLGPYYAVSYTVGREAWHKGSHEASERFNRAIAEIAASHDCLYVDVLAAMDQAPWMVHADLVHSGDLGHQIIANAIFQVLAQNCSGLALRTRADEKTAPRWRDESTLKADYGYGKQKGG